LLENDKSHLTNLHQNAQRLIRPLLVANPYAEQLTFLDTQTRTRRDHMKYLTLIKSIALLHQYWVAQQCEAEKIKQRDFRFSRRDLRSLCGWSEKQVRVHVQRLTDMEYLLVHRGGRGQSFDYELIYAGEGEDNQPFVSGLLGLQNIETSRSKGSSSTQTSEFVGPSCPQRGAVVAGSSKEKNGCVSL